MKTAESIIKEKKHPIISVPPDATIIDALQTMAENGIGTILISTGNQIQGIWTERDLTRNILIPGFDPKITKIGDHMTTDLLWAPHDATVYQMMDKLVRHQIRHLLIKKEGVYIGLLSVGDLILHAMMEKDELLKEASARINNAPGEAVPASGLTAQPQQKPDNIRFEDRFRYDEKEDMFYVNFNGFTVNTTKDVSKIEFMVAEILSPLEKKVSAIVNYENFAINNDVVQEYTAMINRLMEHFYKGVTRYTASSSLQLRLRNALKQANLTPHVYQSSEEARKVLRSLL